MGGVEVHVGVGMVAEGGTEESSGRDDLGRADDDLRASQRSEPGGRVEERRRRGKALGAVDMLSGRGEGKRKREYKRGRERDYREPASQPVNPATNQPTTDCARASLKPNTRPRVLLWQPVALSSLDARSRRSPPSTNDKKHKTYKTWVAAQYKSIFSSDRATKGMLRASASRRRRLSLSRNRHSSTILCPLNTRYADLCSGGNVCFHGCVTPALVRLLLPYLGWTV